MAAVGPAAAIARCYARSDIPLGDKAELLSIAVSQGRGLRLWLTPTAAMAGYGGGLSAAPAGVRSKPTPDVGQGFSFNKLVEPHELRPPSHHRVEDDRARRFALRVASVSLAEALLGRRPSARSQGRWPARRRRPAVSDRGQARIARRARRLRVVIEQPLQQEGGQEAADDPGVGPIEVARRRTAPPPAAGEIVPKRRRRLHDAACRAGRSPGPSARRPGRPAPPPTRSAPAVMSAEVGHAVGGP
jgi:hypothetical protein